MSLVCICGSDATSRCKHCKSDGCCDDHKLEFACNNCKPIEAGYYKDGVVYEQAYYKPGMIKHSSGFGRHWSTGLDKATSVDKGWQDRVRNNVMSASNSYVAIAKRDIDGYTYTPDMIKRVLIDDEVTGDVKPADALSYEDTKFPLQEAPLSIILKQLKEEHFYVIFLTVDQKDASLRALASGTTKYDAVLTLRVTGKTSRGVSGKMYAVSPTLVLVGRAAVMYKDQLAIQSQERVIIQNLENLITGKKVGIPARLSNLAITRNTVALELVPVDKEIKYIDQSGDELTIVMTRYFFPIRADLEKWVYYSSADGWEDKKKVKGGKVVDLSGLFTGITTYSGIFDNTGDFDMFGTEILNLHELANRAQFYNLTKHQPFKIPELEETRVLSKNLYWMTDPKDTGLRPWGVQRQFQALAKEVIPKVTRTKYFFGYAYTWGAFKTAGKQEIMSDVNNIDFRPVIRSFHSRLMHFVNVGLYSGEIGENPRFLELTDLYDQFRGTAKALMISKYKEWADQDTHNFDSVALNEYGNIREVSEAAGSREPEDIEVEAGKGKSRLGLSTHFDLEELFQRPIYTLRLITDSRLAFGTFAQTETNTVFSVPLKMGVLVEMQGPAAYYFTHTVKSEDQSQLSAALIVRKINASKVAEFKTKGSPQKSPQKKRGKK